MDARSIAAVPGPRDSYGMPRLPRRAAAVLTFALALAATPAGAAFATAGDLDTSFDTDGAVFDALSTEYGANVRTPRVAQAPDGSLVAAALSNECLGETCEQQARMYQGAMRVVRVSPSGAILERENLFSGGAGQILDLRVLADGTTVIVRRFDGYRLLLTRLGQDITTGGETIEYSPDFGCPSEDGYRVADASIRADGTVAAAWNCPGGYAKADATRGMPSMSSIASTVEISDLDGNTLDADELYLSEEEVITDVHDLALSPSGEISVLWGDGPDARVSRLEADGDIDLTYGGGDGVASVDVAPSEPAGRSEDPGAFAVDADRRAVVGLTGPQGTWRFLRFDAAGDVDQSGFGTNGVSTVESSLPTGPPAHITIQSDNRILASGAEQYADRPDRATPVSAGIVVARVLANGQADASFGDRGFVAVNLGDSGPSLWPAGPVLQQADGRLVVPSGVPFAGSVGSRAAVAAPSADASHLGLFRMMGATPGPPRTEPVIEQQQSQQQQVRSKACVSRRALRIRLRTGRRKHQQSRIVSAKVWVNGRRVKVTGGSRLRATVNLRNLPKGRFAVKIRLRLADGGIVRETRRYRTCAPKVKRELKPLRTFPPKHRG